MSKVRDLTGQRFGRLTVIKRGDNWYRKKCCSGGLLALSM